VKWILKKEVRRRALDLTSQGKELVRGCHYYADKLEDVMKRRNYRDQPSDYLLLNIDSSLWC
jgi:hypothetical protein